MPPWLRPDWREYTKREAKSALRTFLLIPLLLLAFGIVWFSPGLLRDLGRWHRNYKTCVTVQNETRRVDTLGDVLVIRWRCVKWATRR
jgi:hypothetical protein